MIHTLFADHLSTKQIIHGAGLKSRYHHIWHMDEPLAAACVLLPESTQQVSTILKICHDHGLAVVTHGGLTNLVGSTETKENDVVISLERMNQIEEIDSESRTATVQAGVILEELHRATDKQELLFPLNFGARGSAQIGGIIATNAGGLRVLKYGMTRHLILGLEVVLADGTIVSNLRKIIKDNSGYDLKQLFIGSEGTLGIITKAVVKLVEKPKSRYAAYAGLKKYESVIQLLKYIDAGASGKLTGFELIWKNTYEQLTSASDAVRPPLPYDYEYYVLIEIQGAHPDKDIQLLEHLLENALEEEIIEDAVIARSQSEVDWFFRIREDVNNLVDFMPYDQHFDISIPIPEIGRYIARCYSRFRESGIATQVYAFGHVADGNIHLMIGKNDTSKATKEAIDHLVYQEIETLNGSVSAEHGIGNHKKAYLKFSKSDSEIVIMKALKNQLDPKGIMNPGKIF
ncbi:FAD-binding oxidoreductase [Nonlabens sp. SCSIO 43208]|uniref:FAD-binding oxidoreductase n=1 Tax=Nonlabens sp. SCSIO 43208 TaxID=2793009 RepID=UPI003D6A07CC